MYRIGETVFRLKIRQWVDFWESIAFQNHPKTVEYVSIRRYINAAQRMLLNSKFLYSIKPPRAALKKVKNKTILKFSKLYQMGKFRAPKKGQKTMETANEILVVRPDDNMDNLTVKRLKVFKEISKELGDKKGRVDYEEIAKKVGMSYSGVKYAVGGLLKAKLLGVEDGKLYVIKKSVI